MPVNMPRLPTRATRLYQPSHRLSVIRFPILGAGPMLSRLAASLLLAPVLALAALPLAAAEPLAVGVGTAEITPPLGYPMSGYYHERGATGTLDPLQAKAIVFKQGDVTAALVVGDLIGVDARLAEKVREQVEQDSGIPAANIVVAATHSHTGPDYKADLSKYLALAPSESLPEGDRAAYIPRLIDGLASAVVSANKNAKPAALRVGSGREETVAFNRRGLLKDGKVRTWAPHSEPDVVGPAGPIDPEIGLVAVLPEGADAPAAALVNFALHLDTVGGTQYSADYPGHLERVLRKSLSPGFTTVFATGTCGDINHIDTAHGGPRKSAAEIGERLASSAAAALPGLKPVAANLAVKRAVLDMPLQTYTPEDLAWSEGIIERDRAAEQIPFLDEVKAYRIRRLHQIRTGQADPGRDADAALASADGPRDTLPAEVQAIRLADDAALVALPGEVFVDLGLAIKQASPFEHTFVIELANDNPAYVPTRKAFEEGGYEATNSLYAPGGGELVVETATRLLNDLKP